MGGETGNLLPGRVCFSLAQKTVIHELFHQFRVRFKGAAGGVVSPVGADPLDIGIGWVEMIKSSIQV